MISTDFPVHFLWSEAPPGPVLQATLSRVAPLRYQFRRLFLLSRDERIQQLPLSDAWHIIGEEGVPLVWAYYALREGLLVVYPGHDMSDLPADYDPRQRPWYQQAAGKNGKFWGHLYRDQLGQGLLLTCSMSLFGDSGQLLGVAAVDVDLNYVIERLMNIDEKRALESFLLDAEGHIVIRSSDRNRDPAAVEAPDGQHRPLYPYPDIVADLQAGHFGYREVERDGRTLWIVYDDLETLGWAYVVEFEPDL